MKTKLLYMCLLFFVVSSEAFSEEIKIGCVLPLSGPVSSYGIAIKTSIEKAVNEANQLKGESLKLICKDSQYLEQKGISAYKKLINKDNVDILLGPIKSSYQRKVAHMSYQANKTLFLFGPKVSGIVMNYRYAYAIPKLSSYSKRDVIDLTRQNNNLKSVLKSLGQNRNLEKFLIQMSSAGVACIEIIKEVSVGKFSVKADRIERDLCKNKFQTSYGTFSLICPKCTRSGLCPPRLETCIRDKVETCCKIEE